MTTATIISIGTSKGIRIPKNIIEHFGFDKVSLEILKDGLLIKPIKTSKISSWDTKKLRELAKNDKSDLIDDFATCDVEQKDWEWQNEQDNEINSGAELFGDFTKLKNGELAKNGAEAGEITLSDGVKISA